MEFSKEDIDQINYEKDQESIEDDRRDQIDRERAERDFDEEHPPMPRG